MNNQFYLSVQSACANQTAVQILQIAFQDLTVIIVSIIAAMTPFVTYFASK